MISKCCELVKLCDINRSGPGFFEAHCIKLYFTNLIQPDKNPFRITSTENTHTASASVILLCASLTLR